MKTAYHYDDPIEDEIRRCLRGLFVVGTPLTRATKPEDVRGVDAHYVVDHRMDLQVRARFNRPAYAADSDITFRTTEPPMILAHTYAPVAVFVWFMDRYIVAARLIDVYAMAERIDPALGARHAFANGDGTAFHTVEMSELFKANAVLRIFDGNVWATSTLGGEARLNRLLQAHHEAAPHD
jgi:hypothetical protein